MIDQCKLIGFCHMKWDDLESSLIPQSRFCSSCEKNVFVCRNVKEIEVAAELGRCVALSDKSALVGNIGQPGMDWMLDEPRKLHIQSEHLLSNLEFSILKQLYPNALSHMHEPEHFNTGSWLLLGSFSESTIPAVMQELASVLPNIKMFQSGI